MFIQMKYIKGGIVMDYQFSHEFKNIANEMGITVSDLILKICEDGNREIIIHKDGTVRIIVTIDV